MRRSHLHPSYQVYQAEPQRLINPDGAFNLLIFVLFNHEKIVSQIKANIVPYQTLVRSYFQESKNDA